MLDFVYTLFIAPLEFGMDKALSWGYQLTGNWGWAIIIMSLIVNTVILPIYLKAEHWQEEERAIRKSFEDDESMIKRTFKGQERFAMITTMHRLAGYSPLLTLRSSIGFFLQIPFFFAAYHLLSNFEPFHGVSFLGLSDLSKPDELFSICGLPFNLMPILMTVINIGSALIYTKNLSKRDKYQLYGMAAIFLVLLYNAASGLVLYWTFNNIYSLGKNATLSCIKFKNSQKEKTHIPSYCWTLPLGIALPFAFLWANNIFAYTIGALCFCAALVIGGCFVIQRVLTRFKNCNAIRKNELFITSYAIVLGISICFCGLSIIKGAFYNYRWDFLWILPLLAWILIRCFGFRFVNILLTSQLILSLGIASYNVGADYKSSLNINKVAAESFINFERKPNIYLFFCESYQNLKTVKEVFGYDSSSFIKQLSSLGMVVYENIYSNSSYTVGSLRDLTTMSYKFSTVGNLDAFSSEREIFGGGKGNLLFKTLKDNGYETTFLINGSSGFFTRKGIYLDNTDYQPNTLLLLLTPLLDSNHYFERVASIFIKQDRPHHDMDALKMLQTYLENAEKPQFYVHYLLTAFHTPSDGSYNYKMKESWTKNSGYSEQIKKANQTVLEISQYLRQKDPESIIIFIGDHGPWRIRDFPYDLENKSLNKAKLAEINETYQSVIDDYFHVFSAIYYPKGFKPLEKFSHVNLFPQLFNQLAPNSTKSIEKIERKDNLSIYDGHIMAVEGRANDTFLFW